MRCILTLLLSKTLCVAPESSLGKVALNFRRGIQLILTAIIVSFLLSSIACDAEPRKTDAELGLTPQQAMGRRVYDARCAECHYAYSSRNLRGPSMHGLFQEEVHEQRNSGQR